MRLFYILITFLSLSFFLTNAFAKPAHPGKDLFYNTKSKYGSCNTCHPGGGSAGRWNMETGEIDPEEGRKIPALKGIGKRKNPEQIERSIGMMKKMFGFKLTDEQLSQLVDYVGTL